MLVLYAVRSQDGKWFRAKGYGGYGESWVDDLTSAKLYTKIGPARSRVTYWAREWPDYGIPEIVELHVTKAVVSEEEKAAAEKRLRKRLAHYEEAEVRAKRWELERAQMALEAAQKDLERARAENS